MTQNSRQALIELLFLSLYLDNHLSLAEDDVLTDALDHLGWDSAHPRETFIFQAFSNAREASADAIKIEGFLDQRSDIIKADGAEPQALTWLTKVLGADGISPSEERFLHRLEKRLFA
ncbi:hypothetical protein [Luteolibacter luteus]|uniref:TerB family tellurite resistance protein n=1 Tax=Luteolibacter luteus TaxID=2728835 RepID=A0A858RLU9_9BACT|nr:hypothetical protein [Luteolibacter luteus]QJE97160.1 hypothetical protein HHL09_15635 [Luteolibacter luteus]